MKKIFRIALMLTALTFSPAIYGSPCVPDTLESYIALGSTGCEIGPNFRVRDFSALIVDAVVGGNLPDGAEININPLAGPMGPSLTFSPTSGTSWSGSGALAGVYSATLGFTVESINPFWSFLGSSLSAEGEASGVGLAAIAEVQCLGGILNGLGPPLSACLGGGVTAGLAADVTNAVDGEVSAAVVFAPVFEIDVIKSLNVVGTFLGTAEITSFTEGFTAQDATPVPEPTTATLLGGALLGFAWFRRKRPNGD